MWPQNPPSPALVVLLCFKARHSREPGMTIGEPSGDQRIAFSAAATVAFTNTFGTVSNATP